MRTANIVSNSMEYPDEVVFCFNPNIVKVYTDNEVTFVISTGSGNSTGTFDSTFDRTFTIVRQPYFMDEREDYNKYVELDISSYLQACFVT